MHRWRVAALAVLLAASLTWLLWPPAPKPRKTALQRVQDFGVQSGGQKAIFLIGDSLIDWAPFPPVICGRPVVNAGEAGSRAGDVLQLIDQLRRMRLAPATVVISVGINNAIFPELLPFAKTYRALVRQAVGLGGKVFLVSLAPVADTGSMVSVMDRSRWAEVRRTIQQTAEELSVPLIDVSVLDTAASPVTEDGVHLSKDGYVAWTGLIESAISRECKGT